MTDTSYSMEGLVDKNLRGAFTVYCDDYREESTGKGLFIGVYGDELLVTEYPAALPTFVVITTVWTVVTNRFKKLIFRILVDESVVSEQVFDIEEADEAWDKAVAATEIRPAARQVVRRIARFSPFVAEKDAVIRVRIETEDGELRTAGLQIRKVDSLPGARPTRALEGKKPG